LPKIGLREELENAPVMAGVCADRLTGYGWPCVVGRIGQVIEEMPAGARSAA
jgi:hypothetical protein